MSDVLALLANPDFWVAVLRIATPLVFGTLGVLLCERAGVPWHPLPFVTIETLVAQAEAVLRQRSP